jgi:hypothetical protein
MDIQNFETRLKLHKLEVSFITAGREVLRDREIRVGDLLEDLRLSNDKAWCLESSGLFNRDEVNLLNGLPDIQLLSRITRLKIRASIEQKRFSKN